MLEKKINLVADDRHVFSAYAVAPVATKKKQALIVLQEIYGVNQHIRNLCKKYADLGYYTLSPSLFDRLEKNVELMYNEKDLLKGRSLKTSLGWDRPLLDIDACIKYCREEGFNSIAVMGFCWGGSLAWLSACRLHFLSHVICYYGAQIIDFINETPKSPVLLHFGKKDPLIELRSIEKIRSTHPSIKIHLYEAGHGFHCDERVDYNKNCTEESQEKNLFFLSNSPQVV